MKLLFHIALIAAKICRLGLRIIGRNASYLPGKIALTLCPKFLKHIGKPETIIGVTGTNGKTTTANIIRDTLEYLGEKVLSNRYGSNVDAGIASALLTGTTLGGKSKHKIAVLEIDERSSKRVYPYVEPALLVVTNIFRDSMYRNAHTEYITEIISAAVPEKTRLILNADDVICSTIAPEHRDRVYFGLSGHFRETHNTICDALLCPKCSSPLNYTELRYNHIGRVECPGCRTRSPKPDYEGHIENSRLIVSGTSYKPLSASLPNLYNQVAAIAALSELGIARKRISDAMAKVEIVRSRFSVADAGGVSITAIMAKGLNSIACSGVFDQVRTMPGVKAVLLLLDDVYDEKDSSENISWIYDADFEFLSDPSVSQIAVAGIRHLDYALRLRIAGVDEDKIKTTADSKCLADLLDVQRCDSIVLLFELYRYDEAQRVRGELIKRLEATE